MRSRTSATGCRRVTESKSGGRRGADRFAVPATAIAWPAAGDVGINAKCECQPMSLMALPTGVDAKAIPQFVREVAGEKAKPNLQKLMNDAASTRPTAGRPCACCTAESFR